MSNIEQTLSIIKPDAVERNLEEEIKQFFIKSGFKIIKQKIICITMYEVNISSEAEVYMFLVFISKLCPQ